MTNAPTYAISPVKDKQTLTEQTSLSALYAKDSFDLDFLVRKHVHLLDAGYTRKADAIEFFYDTSHMHPFSDIKQVSLEEKYLFLINCADLEETFSFIAPTLDENELFFDDKFFPRFKKRDIINPDTRIDFLGIYKAISLATLIENTRLDTLRNVSLSCVEESDEFGDIASAKTPTALKEVLYTRLENLKKQNEKMLIQTNKTKFFIYRAGFYIVGILCVVLALYGIYARVVTIHDKDLFLQGYKSFVVKDWAGAIDAFEDLDVKKLDITSKYIAAVSYAKTENLNQDSIDRVVSRLSVTSDERELEYWIFLGRLDFEAAKNMAYSLVDDQLIMYALVKEREACDTNTDISGNEKKEALEKLDAEIERIAQKYIDAKESK